MTDEQVQSTILQGMAGGHDDVLDAMEVAAILLIPTLLKAADQLIGSLPKNMEKPPDDLLEIVLSHMLEDVSGRRSWKAVDALWRCL